MVTGNEHADILEKVYESVSSLDKNMTLSWLNQAMKQNISPKIIIKDGLCKGIKDVGKKCESGELFFPKLIEFSQILDAAMTILKSKYSPCPDLMDRKIVIGVVEGDIHDIGKNILKSALTSYGFKIIDLGKDVPSSVFIDSAIEEKADMICMSTFLDTTVSGMQDVILGLEKNRLKNQIRVMVGGEAVNEEYARSIGADGYAPNAAMAVDLAISMLCRTDL